MKIRLIALLLIACISSSIATAQTFQIRANRGLNLRADSSLQSRVVDTVRAGDTLQVVGSFNKWLKIDRNGSSVWLADWTDYSRVQESTQSVAQPVGAAIDNCCFVDSQCSSDQDWTDGYFRFQRGECPAPPQPAISVPAAPVSSPVAAGGRPQPLRPESATPHLPHSITDWSRVGEPGVDNCCQIGWDCQNDTEWLRGFQVYQASQCHHSALVIAGSNHFKSMAEQAFVAMRSRAPHWYAYVISGLHGATMLGPNEGGGTHPNHRSYQTGFHNQHAPTESDVFDFVGGLAHEACHLHMWNRGLAVASWTNELPCVEAQLYATEAVDPINRQSYWLRDLIANLHDPSRWWW